jgi:hypothetical protein
MQPENLISVRTAIMNSQQSGDIFNLAATVMPDHVHLLLELTGRLPVSRAIGKIKAAVTRNCHAITWQANFFDHRLRFAEKREAFAFYIFMNPYRAGLCPTNQSWSGWISLGLVQWEFEAKLQNGAPPGEWLVIPEELDLTSVTGND